MTMGKIVACFKVALCVYESTLFLGPVNASYSHVSSPQDFERRNAKWKHRSVANTVATGIPPESSGDDVPDEVIYLYLSAKHTLSSSSILCLPTLTSC